MEAGTALAEDRDMREKRTQQTHTRRAGGLAAAALFCVLIFSSFAATQIYLLPRDPLAAFVPRDASSYIHVDLRLLDADVRKSFLDAFTAPADASEAAVAVLDDSSTVVLMRSESQPESDGFTRIAPHIFADAPLQSGKESIASMAGFRVLSEIGPIQGYIRKIPAIDGTPDLPGPVLFSATVRKGALLAKMFSAASPQGSKAAVAPVILEIPSLPEETVAAQSKLGQTGLGSRIVDAFEPSRAAFGIPDSNAYRNAKNALRDAIDAEYGAVSFKNGSFVAFLPNSTLSVMRTQFERYLAAAFPMIDASGQYRLSGISPLVSKETDPNTVTVSITGHGPIISLREMDNGLFAASSPALFANIHHRIPDLPAWCHFHSVVEMLHVHDFGSLDLGNKGAELLSKLELSTFSYGKLVDNTAFICGYNASNVDN